MSRLSRHRNLTSFFAITIVLILIVGGTAVEAPGGRREYFTQNKGETRQATALKFAATDGQEWDSPYLVINLAAGRICLRSEDSVYLDAPCSAGSGAKYRDPQTGRVWNFATPTGVFAITAKAEDPLWRKPDWAYLEEGSAVPTEPAERLIENYLGGYSLAFGDGYYIHGTVYTRLLGMNVTHGCVRVADEHLENIYQIVEIGTPLIIF